MAFVRCAEASDLREGDVLGCTAAGRRVLLVKADGVVRAYEDRCAHLGVPLSLGRLEGRVLTCAAHHWQYDVCTGEGVNPRTARLCPLPLRVEGGAVWVDALPGVPGAAP